LHADSAIAFLQNVGDDFMKQRARLTSALLVAGAISATGAVAETAAPVHQAQWEKCYRSCETTYGTNETGTGSKFRACVARCEDKWLSTMSAPAPKSK
jgi:uncharacterized membrane protein